MKLRLIAPPYDTMNGHVGVVEFVDGLSVGDVHPNEARRIASVFGAVWEDGSAADPNTVYQDNYTTGAQTTEEVRAEREAESTAVKVERRYTEAELAEVVEKKGIEGLREIGDPLGVKAKSIKALVDGILELAGAKAE